MLAIWSGAIFMLIFNEVVLCLIRIWIHQSLKLLCDCFVRPFCWHCDWMSVGWTGGLQLLLPVVERAAQSHTASHLPVMVWRKSTLLIADLSLSRLSLLTLSAAPLCSRWYCNKPTAGSHLCMCVCVFEFHVLVKFSFWQQIEQHQVTHNCSLRGKKRKKCTAFGLLFCRRCIIDDAVTSVTYHSKNSHSGANGCQCWDYIKLSSLWGTNYSSLRT